MKKAAIKREQSDACEKKLSIAIVIVIMAMMMTAACSQEDGTRDDNGYRPVEIESAAVTRALQPGVTPYYGSSLALTYIYPGSPFNMVAGTSSDKFTRFGVEWQKQTNGNVTRWVQTGETASTMLWKSLEDRVNMYAYAPFIEPPTEGMNYTAIPFSIQVDQSDSTKLALSDLVAWQELNYYPTAGQDKISVIFRHLLSGLTVTLTSGPGGSPTKEELKDAEVTIQNVTKGVTFSLQDMIPHTTEGNGTENLTEIIPCKGSEERTWHCVFPEQTISANTLFVTIRVGNKTYNYQPVSDLHFEKDTAYRLTLEIGDTRLVPKSVDVVPWGAPVLMTDDELELK
jgi:hypothetical protein